MSQPDPVTPVTQDVPDGPGGPEVSGRPVTVSVLGSCITRDNFNSRFNPDYKRWYRVGPTTNQSSMIALMSPPVDEPWEPVQEMKPYGLWNVRSDLSREILTLLPEEQPDVVVLDFFGDAHFGVVRLPDGRFVTDNRWRIHKTDLYERILAMPGTERLSWEQDADGYFGLWVEAMDRFAAYVADQLPDTQVVVHWGFNADEVVPSGESTPRRMPSRRRRAARKRNAFWRRLNEHASSAYGWESIDLSREYYVTLDDHPWGPMEVHYTLDYYPRFLAELDRVVLTRSAPEEVRVLARELHEAAAEYTRDTARWRIAAHEHQRALAVERERPTWKRVLRPRGPGAAPVPPAPPAATATLLEALRGAVDDDAFARLSRLATTAEEHVRWLRETPPTLSAD